MPLPDDVDPRELDADVRRDLRSLSKDTAELVAKHLVVTGRLIDDEPERALTHARAAGALAGRVGAVREAVGLAAYAAGQWQEALAELRTARRITGDPQHLAVLADCERALGRPERALAVLDDPQVTSLEQAARVELVVVVSGARRDLGQPDAAVLLLQGPARATTARRPWAARLWYAYAEALLAAGREEEARDWFARAAQHDAGADTDAAERLLALDGVVLDLDDQDPLHDTEDEVDAGDAGHGGAGGAPAGATGTTGEPARAASADDAEDAAGADADEDDAAEAARADALLAALASESRDPATRLPSAPAVAFVEEPVAPARPAAAPPVPAVVDAPAAAEPEPPAVRSAPTPPPVPWAEPPSYGAPDDDTLF